MYFEMHASCIDSMLVFKVDLGNEAPMVTTKAQYTTIALAMAAIVPKGMLLAGSFKSPLKLAPSMMPVAMGNNTANTKLQLQRPLSHMVFTSCVAPVLVSLKFHHKLSCRLSKFHPVTVVFVNVPFKQELIKSGVHWTLL